MGGLNPEAFSTEICLLLESFGFDIQIIQLLEQEVLSLPRRGNDAVGHGFFQFIIMCTCLLRQREVFLQSVRAPDGNCTANPDEFTCLVVENFGILKVKDFFSGLHNASPRSRALRIVTMAVFYNEI